MRGVRHSISVTESLSSGGASMSFLIVSWLRNAVSVSWPKDAPINPYFLVRQLLSHNVAPHRPTFWVATRLRFSTPHRDPLIQKLPILACIFNDRSAVHLELTTTVSPANIRPTVCSISGLHLYPIGGPMSSTKPSHLRAVPKTCATALW
ncbi:hypothetical protein TRVL_07523 [Trypanosoma vivax]|nr:hypothetical protein TRVL_07523 [Trypanosoma vivax]